MQFANCKISRSTQLMPKIVSRIFQFSSVQSLSCVWLFATPAHQASLSITNSQSSPKPMFIESVMPSSHLKLCHAFLLLPSIFSSISISSNELALRIRWPKYWSFRISPSDEHSGSISFRIDWLDLLAVQGTLKSLRQHHSSKASILWHSVFFIVQLSHPYMTTGKTIALTRWTFISTVISLLFNRQDPSAMQETWVWSLGWEDLMEEGMATHWVFLPGESPWPEEPGGLQSLGLQRAGHNWATKHSSMMH